MPSALHQAKAVADLADLLYSFLPASGDRSWTGHVTFQTVAVQNGVGEFWTGGSKRPALTRLLENTLKHRRSQFEPLVLAIVSEGIKYRRGNNTTDRESERKNKPVRESEIIAVNRVIKDLGFKFPELWDPAFLASLERDPVSTPKETAQPMSHASPVAGSIQAELPDLRAEFYRLAGSNDRQAAGLSLEKLLNRLFHLFGMTPRQPFRVVGEQIDGSFQLDHEIYLLEAKWETKPVNEAALLTFRGKIEGKSMFTRGLFLSINGFTPDCLAAITQGKQPTFILADGGDLSPVLEQAIRLDDLLRQKVRTLAETGVMLSRGRSS